MLTINNQAKFYFGLLLCTVISLLIFYPLFSRIILSIPPSNSHYDYTAHISYAQQLLDNKLSTSHPLFHILTIFLYKISSKLTWYQSALIVVLVSKIVSSVIVYFFLCRIHNNFIMLSLYAVSLNIISPIYIFVPFDGNFCLGYITQNCLHNPTLIVLNVCSLMLFIQTQYFFFNNRHSLCYLLVFFLLIICDALAKPSFIIIMLPALSILYLLHHNEMNLKYVFASCLLCFGILTCMFIVTYLFDNATVPSKVVLTIKKPFMYALVRTPYYSWIFLKIMFSILFPLYVFFIYTKICKNDIYFQYSLLLMLFSLVFYGFFIESGPRIYDGNFTWSACTANLLLFLASFRIFLHHNNFTSIKCKIGWLIFALHIFCGIIYYIRLYLNYIYY